MKAKRWKQSRCCNLNPYPSASMRLEMHLKNIDMCADCTHAMQSVFAFVCIPDCLSVLHMAYTCAPREGRPHGLNRSSIFTVALHRLEISTKPAQRTRQVSKKRQHKSLSMYLFNMCCFRKHNANKINTTSHKSNEASLTNCT
jgi:hypothetical protein